MMSIVVYNGHGTQAVEILCHSLEDMLKKLGLRERFSVETTSAKYLHKKEWINTTKLLIIPGGRDLPYVEDLSGDAVTNIRSFVISGGSYLGICAGAYFSCSHVSFEKGTPLEVTGARDLNLFRGFAKGCVYPGFKYSSTVGSRSVPLTCFGSVGECIETCYAYYNGGCEFIESQGFTEFETLATYKDYYEKKAVISLAKGKGKVVLSGVHPEMDVTYLDQSTYSKGQWLDMVKHADQQNELFKWILNYLLSD